MYSLDQFGEIENELYSSARDYHGSHPNDELARTTLITAEGLARIHRNIEEHLGEIAPERYQYQDVFFSKGVNAVFALYQLVKRYRYDAAFREVRYLMETYFVLRGLNRDKERAGEIYLDFKNELESLEDRGEVEQALHDFDSVDRLFGVWREERNAAEEVWPDVKRVYNYFSNRSSHPVRIVGSGMDGQLHEELEARLFTWGLYLSYGLTTELLKTYLDTSAADFIRQESQPIVREFDQVLGKDVPAFLLNLY